MTLIREESAFVLPLPKSPIICNTDGKGLWSDQVRAVRTNKVVVSIHQGMINYWHYAPDLYISIDAYFPNSSWEILADGLIYTDRRWLKDFTRQMKAINPRLFGSCIDYTEQGMQGENHVSLHMYLTSFKAIKRFDQGLYMIKDLKWLDHKKTIFATS